MTQALGVVHVLVAGEASKDGLPEQPNERMPPVLAGAGVGERFARHGGKPKRVVEFAIGEQSRVRSDHRSAKLEHQPTVEIDPENLAD
jgi:hypothetical protein